MIQTIKPKNTINMMVKNATFNDLQKHLLVPHSIRRNVRLYQTITRLNKKKHIQSVGQTSN